MESVRDSDNDGRHSFIIRQPGKAEIVAFVFNDELTAARHFRALEDPIPDIVTITLHRDTG